MQIGCGILWQTMLASLMNRSGTEGILRKKNLSFDFVGTILVLFASVERPPVPLLTLDVGVS